MSTWRKRKICENVQTLCECSECACRLKTHGCCLCSPVKCLFWGSCLQAWKLLSPPCLTAWLHNAAARPQTALSTPPGTAAAAGYSPSPPWPAEDEEDVSHAREDHWTHAHTQILTFELHNKDRFPKEPTTSIKHFYTHLHSHGVCLNAGI